MSTITPPVNEIASKFDSLSDIDQKRLLEFFYSLIHKKEIQVAEPTLKLFDLTDLLDAGFPQWSEEDIAPILEVREGFNKHEVQTW